MKFSKHRPSRAAIIDLGSNTFKLMLVEQAGKKLSIHYETAITVRLGERLHHTRKLPSKAILRALQALKKFQKHIKKFHAKKIIALGTHALRSAKNRNSFLKPAEKILGIKIHVISGKKEGELVYAGISSNPSFRKSEILNLDIGGGSTECIHGKKRKLSSVESIPIGCVHLRDLFFKRYPVSPIQITHTEKYIQKKLSPIAKKHTSFHGKLLSSGGTINALCSILYLSNDYRSFEGKKITQQQLHNIIIYLSSLSLPQIRKIPFLPSDRADIILPGALILYTSMKLLNIKTLQTSTRGLRYGALALAYNISSFKQATENCWLNA